MNNRHPIASPPNIAVSIASGFDLTAKHLWLALIPVALDVFFWIGPRLSFRQLVEQMVAFWQQEALISGFNEQALLDLAPHTNLLTGLSIPLIGIPTKFVGLAPEITPLPTRVYEVDDVWSWALLYLLVSLLGLLCTAVYFVLISDAVRKSSTMGVDRSLTVIGHVLRVGGIWLRLLVVITLLLILLIGFYVPYLLVTSLVSLLSQGAATVLLLTGPIFALWLLFCLSMVPQGLALHRRPVWRAIVESFQIVQKNLAQALGLILGIMVINRLLDWLLAMADDGSWFTMVSIMGHAYVSTALVAATFIFYRYRFAILKSQE